MLLTSFSSARSHATASVFGLSRVMRRPRRWLLGGAALLAILLLPSAPRLAHASGGTWQGFVYHGPSGSRPYFVYTPTHYHPGTSVPLIVMLHGCAQTAEDFAVGTRMNELAGPSPKEVSLLAVKRLGHVIEWPRYD